MRVRAHEGAFLELRESDVLSRVCRVQPELEGELPRSSPQNGVSEQSDLQRVDPRDALACDIGSDLATPHRLVQRGQGLRAPESRREQLVLRRDRRPLARKLKRRAAAMTKRAMG